jgi:PAS domain S-box-containing protein
MYTLLYVDDEPGLLEIGQIFLENTGDFHVVTALSAQDALMTLQKQRFDAIVSDFQMPEMNGIDLLKQVRSTYGEIPFILFTGRGREEIVIEAINNGVDFYLQKGGDPRAQFAELAHKIRQAVGRRHTETALSDSEQRLTDIINFLPDATFAIDTEGTVIAWNRAIEEVTGTAAADILGKGNYEYAAAFYGERRPMLIDLVMKPDAAFEQAQYIYTRRSSTTLTAETILEKEGEPPVHLWGKATRLCNEQGELTGAIEAIRDITEMKNAENALSDSKRRLADIINFLPDATFAIDTEGTVIAWNRAIEEMTGTAAADIIGKGAYEYALPFYGSRRPILIDLIFEPEDRIQQYYSNILRDGNTLSAETDLPHPKGHRIHVLAKASPLYNQEGSITGAIESIRDITDRIKAEEEIRAANEQLAASGEELREQYDELAAGEKRIRESETRLSYMIGFYERDWKTERELLNYAIEGAGIVTGSPMGYLAFMSGDETELAMYAWSRSAMKECTMREKPIVYKTEKTGLWGEPVRQRRPVITNDYEAPDPMKKGYPEGHPRIVRHLGIPVIDEGHIVLVAGVANKPSDYTDHDVHEIVLLMQGLWTIIKRKRAEEDRRESEGRLRAAYEQVAATEEELRSQYNELAKAQEELLLHRQQLEEITSTVPGVVYQIAVHPDKSMELLYTNIAAAERIFGYDHTDEDIYRWFSAHVHTEDRVRFDDSIREILNSRTFWFFEGRFSKPSGEVIWFQVRSSPIVHGDNLVYTGVFLNITDRKNTEIALQESEAKYRLITERSPDMIYFVDPGGYIHYANTRAADMMQATPEALVGKHLTEIFSDTQARRHLDAIHRIISTGSPVQTEVQEELPSGKCWIDVRLSPLVDEKGIILGVLGLSHDISDRKQAEESLRESEAKYRVLVENSHDIVYTISPDGILTFVSPSWTALLGYDSAFTTGKPFRQFVHPADIPEFEAFLAKVTSTGQRLSGGNYRVLHANGSVRVHTSTITPIMDDTGAVISYVGNARDITDMQQFQNAIKESNRKLNLLSSITRHDVANQLTVVQGYTQLAQLRKPDPVIVDFLAKIETAVERIQAQIEFTRTYQDLGMQEPAWFPVGDVIRSVKPSGLSLDCTCDSCEVFADPMIDKVFLNLFDNAVRYGMKVTTVTVRCRLAGDELVITFADDGVGIPLDEKQKIFKKGYGKHTGFGLFLVREILAITGISIHETGFSGKGARFEISVPKGTYRSVPE